MGRTVNPWLAGIVTQMGSQIDVKGPKSPCRCKRS
ncbi:hypothetical protein BRC2024_ULFKEANI_CDS_0061 [Acinetobacter phage vB_AbaM_Konradin-v2]